MRRLAPALLLLSLLLPAQRPFSGAAELRQAVDQLGVLGSVLMIAAHPDDENTAVVTYFARGRKMRMGYLSLTRGEGGQNLIGSEQGDAIGIIRTQELMAARRVDGGEQFFSRAVDFGFSKSAKETLAKWEKEKVLSDVVWVIRRFQPDVIVFRFSGTPRDGHGQHQASAIVGKEAFAAAADPTRFPEQLQQVKPWQAKRAVFNAFNFSMEDEKAAEKMPGRVMVDLGEYNPVLGYSYSELASISRSQHKSQAMGSGERRGKQNNYFITVAGEAPTKDLFDGIDTTWGRVPDGKAIGELMAQASRELDERAPTKILPILAQARQMLSERTDVWAMRKRKELDEVMAMCAGIWFDASTRQWQAVPGSTMDVRVSFVNRSGEAAELMGVEFRGADGIAPLTEAKKLPANELLPLEAKWTVPAKQPFTQPYWLEQPKRDGFYSVDNQSLIGNPETAPALVARASVRVAGTLLTLERPVVNRYVDRLDGEMTRPLVVVPPVAVRMPESSLVFPDQTPRAVEIIVRANAPKQEGSVAPKLPTGWTAEPASLPFSMTTVDEERTLRFRIVPPAGETSGVMTAVAKTAAAEVNVGTYIIRYPHIPPQTLAPRAEAKLVRVNAKITARRVGYVMGAGDEVADALKQLGCEVTLLSAEDLQREDLSRYQAIVSGVRAFNTRPDLRANIQRLYDYVSAGGVFVVQYNVIEGGFWGGDPKILDRVGPYPLTINRDRITDENAAVTLTQANHPLLNAPNRITEKDFEGWVQERGLYHANTFDPRYTPLFSWGDPEEKPQLGSTLVTRYGRGTYIFTPLSWFRQLPAGVPGAFRIFANFLSGMPAEKGKVVNAGR
jgi:LmbE family N-acetylglucosaminyl deacetylase